MDGKYRLVVGLGNPGLQYANTKHNVGFMVVDKLVNRYASGWHKAKSSNYSMVKLNGRDKEVYIVKPLTFMNLSGDIIPFWLSKIGAKPKEMIVVHDDLDLDLPDIKVKVGGGSGGHKGIQSIIEAVGDRNFVRVKVGVGLPEEVRERGLSPGRKRKIISNWVLSPFPESVEQDLKESVGHAVEAIDLILTEGVQAAQNKFNRRVSV